MSVGVGVNGMFVLIVVVGVVCEVWGCNSMLIVYVEVVLRIVLVLRLSMVWWFNFGMWVIMLWMFG